MNLRNKIILITIVTIIALVGVGFATWTFTNSVTESVSAISGAVTAAIEAKNVEVKTADGSATVSALYIICDSPTTGHGIYWSTTNDTTAFANKIEQVKLIGSVNEDDNDILDFTTYVGNFSCTFAAVSGTYVSVAALAIDHNETSESKNADVEYVINLPALSYATTPTDVAGVNALETEVNALNLTLTFNFEVKSVA